MALAEWAKATTSLLALAVVALGAERTLATADRADRAALMGAADQPEIMGLMAIIRTALAVQTEARPVNILLVKAMSHLQTTAQYKAGYHELRHSRN